MKVIISGRLETNYMLRKALSEYATSETQKYNTTMLTFKNKEIARRALEQAANIIPECTLQHNALILGDSQARIF